MKRARSFVCLLLVFVTVAGIAAIPASAADAYPNSYINTGDQKQDALGVARTQVGYKEGKNNYTKYGMRYHLPYEAWCAMYISWSLRKGGVPTSIVKNSAVASAGKFGLKYRDGASSQPKIGDLFYTKKFSHIGFVYYVDGDYFYTLEGNSTNDGSNDGNRVLCNKRLCKDYYFSTPAYEGAGTAPAAPSISVFAGCIFLSCVLQ